MKKKIQNKLRPCAYSTLASLCYDTKIEKEEEK